MSVRLGFEIPVKKISKKRNTKKNISLNFRHEKRLNAFSSLSLSYKKQT